MLLSFVACFCHRSTALAYSPELGLLDAGVGLSSIKGGVIILEYHLDSSFEEWSTPHAPQSLI
jgi:hypothetical protein